MAASILQFAKIGPGDLFAGTNANTTSLSCPGSAAASSWIVVEFITESVVRSVISVADAAGSVYSRLGTTQNGDGGSVDIWFAPRIGATSGDSIVVTLDGTTSAVSYIGVHEIAGLAASQVAAQYAQSALAANDSHGTTGLVPSNATGILIAVSARTTGTYAEDLRYTENDLTNATAFLGTKLNPASGVSFGLYFGSTGNEASVNKLLWLAGAVDDSSTSTPRLYAPDGSINIRLNDGLFGLYTVEGYLRVDTITGGNGLYGPSGAYRAQVSADAGSPPSGTGRYNLSGALRITVTGSTNFGTTGLYALDGSMRATIKV